MIKSFLERLSFNFYLTVLLIFFCKRYKTLHGEYVRMMGGDELYGVLPMSHINLLQNYSLSMCCKSKICLISVYCLTGAVHVLIHESGFWGCWLPVVVVVCCCFFSRLPAVMWDNFTAFCYAHVTSVLVVYLVFHELYCRAARK